MKIARKKLAFLVAIVCLSLILTASYLFNQNNIAKSEPQPQSDFAEAPGGSLLVIPESSIGTLGILGALAGAFGMFVILKKRK
ncbi:MAG: hypothetical protein D4S01_01505 [Dehalococcoidia bacterium]|nr:MAG: hypothetical protein D4S01_01505 [Dehalococcoidia bacterium]